MSHHFTGDGQKRDSFYSDDCDEEISQDEDKQEEEEEDRNSPNSAISEELSEEDKNSGFDGVPEAWQEKEPCKNKKEEKLLNLRCSKKKPIFSNNPVTSSSSSPLDSNNEELLVLSQGKCKSEFPACASRSNAGGKIELRSLSPYESALFDASLRTQMSSNKYKNATPTSQSHYYVGDKIAKAKLRWRNEKLNSQHDLQRHIKELTEENRTLNRLVKRQGCALDKLAGSSGELPTLLYAHNEETRIIRQKLKQVQDVNRLYEDKLKAREEEIYRLRDLSKHLHLNSNSVMNSRKHSRLSNHSNMDFEDLKSQLEERDRQVADLMHQLQVIKKSSKQQLQNEISRHCAVKKKLDEAHKAIDELRNLITEKDKVIHRSNIYAHRSMSRARSRALGTISAASSMASLAPLNNHHELSPPSLRKPATSLENFDHDFDYDYDREPFEEPLTKLPHKKSSSRPEGKIIKKTSGPTPVPEETPEKLSNAELDNGEDGLTSINPDPSTSPKKAVEINETIKTDVDDTVEEQLVDVHDNFFDEDVKQASPDVDEEVPEQLPDSAQSRKSRAEETNGHPETILRQDTFNKDEGAETVDETDNEKVLERQNSFTKTRQFFQERGSVIEPKEYKPKLVTKMSEGEKLGLWMPKGMAPPIPQASKRSEKAKQEPAYEMRPMYVEKPLNDTKKAGLLASLQALDDPKDESKNDDSYEPSFAPGSARSRKGSEPVMNGFIPSENPFSSNALTSLNSSTGSSVKSAASLDPNKKAKLMRELFVEQPDGNSANQNKVP